jgi:hypothetical protein
MDRKYNHNWSESTTTFEHALESLQDILDELYAKTINKVLARRERKISVRVDDSDIWNADETLALVIAPVLKKIREDKSGIPTIEDEDVPENIRRINSPDENGMDTFVTDGDEERAVSRWEWVLDEMIFAFESFNYNSEDDYSSGEIDYHWEKAENGLYKMVEGPNHTYKVDNEALKKHQNRVDNGLRLFAKYYRCLWT